MIGDKIVYRINERDQIVFVSDTWDHFASANAGERVMSARILEHSLWDYIADSTTRVLYRQMLHQVRAGGFVQFEFRCDSPAQRRLLAMEIGRGAQGTVEFCTRTLSIEDREPVALFGVQASDPNDFLRICGWCKKLFVDGSWEEVEAAAERLQLFQRTLMPTLTHGICEPCQRKVIETLAQS